MTREATPNRATYMRLDVWRQVDWGKGNAELAAELGVTRQRVHQVRRAVGAPPPDPARDRRRRALLERRECVLRLAQDHTPKQIAHALGVTVDTVYSDLKGLGTWARKHRPGAWAHDWDSVDWESKTNTMIAEEIGATATHVGITRRRQGRPDGPDGRVPSTWTSEVVAWKRERGLLPSGWE